MAAPACFAVPRSMTAALLLAATFPALAQERRITVPDLADPAARDRFRAVFTRTCDRPPDIREQPEPMSRRASGTVLGQSPAAGSIVPCSQTGFVIRVAGPAPSQQEQTPTPSGAGQQILEDLLEGLAKPPPPKSLTVPDLAPPGAVEAFEAATRETCGRRLTIRDETADSSLPPGTIIAQRPEPGTTLSCRRPTVTLTRAVAPAALPEESPAEAPALFVPALVNPAARDTFESLASRTCGTRLSITLRRRETTGPANRFLAQSPPQGSRYRCGTPVTVTLSAARPAPPRPDAPPARQEPPAEPARPEPALPANPIVVPEAPPPDAPTPAPPPVSPPALQPPAVPSAPPPAVPPALPATPVPPEPSGLPLAALIAAAVALLGGGFLAGRLLSRRAPPKPAPKPGVRRGTTRITTALEAPPDLAGPALGLVWRRPTVRAEAAPEIAREEIDHG